MIDLAIFSTQPSPCGAMRHDSFLIMSRHLQMTSFLTFRNLIEARSLRISLAAMLLGTVLGCAKIADFTEPFMSEVFMGNCSITPSVKGIYSAATPVCTVGISGDASGETVTIHGVPTNEPFEVIPEKLYKLANTSEGFLTFPPTVSGFRADVIDRHTLEVTGFAHMSDPAKDFELEVSGTIVRHGPQMATQTPIVISTNMGALRELFDDIILKAIQRISDGKSLSDFDDDEEIPLYRIDFRPEIMTVF